MAARRRQPIYEKPYRTILLWILWAAAAIGVYLTLYLNTDLLAQLKQDQSKITWIIIGLFILGLIISLGLAFTITTADNASHCFLNRLGRRLDQLGG